MKHLSLLAVAATAGIAVALTTQPNTAPVTGAATGKVKLEGAKPEIKPLSVDSAKFPDCGPVDTTNESALVSESGGIANVVLTVEIDGAEVKPLEKAVELDQKSCRFEPHVTVVPAGSSVEFINSDKTSHNVHTFPGKNDAMNKTVPAGGKETQKLEKEDRIEVKCDIHPWMNSFVVVANTNYYAVSDKEGNFKIEGLPAGEHKVKLWHETFGKGEGKIVVNADGTAAPVEFTMSAEKKGGGRRR